MSNQSPGITDEIQYTKITKMQAILKVRELHRELERLTKRYDILVDAEFRQCKEIESLRTELAEKDKVLEWYADTENHDGGYARYDADGEQSGFESFVEEDYGEKARSILNRYKKGDTKDDQ